MTITLRSQIYDLEACHNRLHRPSGSPRPNGHGKGIQLRGTTAAAEERFRRSFQVDQKFQTIADCLESRA